MPRRDASSSSWPKNGPSLHLVNESDVTIHDGNGDRSLSGARTAAFTLAAAAAWQAATEMPLIPG